MVPDAKKRKIHATESGSPDRIPPTPKHEKGPEFLGIPGKSDLPSDKSLAGAEGFGLACRLGQFAHARHWRSLTPRHAVLEWMWEKHERTYNS